MNKAQQQPQDDFGAFLWTVNRSFREEKKSESSRTSMRIVRYLAQTHEARVERIMTQVRAPFGEFTDGLKELSEAGLIKMDDSEDGSVIELTDEGLRWAQTMLTLGDDDEEESPPPRGEKDE
jgi:predicted transcriptional regulator